MITTMYDLLESTANLFPNKVAIKSVSSEITFQNLINKINQVSNIISEKNIYHQNIGVYAKQNIETLIIFFAIMKSGNTYVMLDPESPSERLNHIFENAKINYLLNYDNDFSIIKINNFENVNTELSKKSISDILYIVYTSGSTGVPKGVAKSHLSMLTFVESFVEEFNITCEDIIANQTPFYFDASAKDIFTMAKTGATLVLIPKDYFSFPAKLIEYLNTTKTTVISWVPSALSIVVQLNTFSFIKPEYLKKVFFVGEVFPIKYLNMWINSLPDTEFINLYGSSEVAGIVCYYKVKGIMDEKELLPIGKSLKNAKVFLLNEDNQLAANGEEGELCVSGPLLSNGYYGDIEKTNKIFVQNPINTYYNEVIYRSGDLAVMDSSGNFVFHGRKDFQIKHMGQRIELGEIESVCSSLKYIKDCCCLYDDKKKKIIMFYTTYTKEDILSKMKDEIKNYLPNYMIPNKYIKLENMPKNQNGKTNRTELKLIIEN